MAAASKDKLKRLAILGGGAVTRIFYVPALVNHYKIGGSFELAFVVDTNSNALQKLRRLGCPAGLLEQGFEEFLTDDHLCHSIDAVIVALPHHLHEAAVCLALDRGLNVICEKPLALSALSSKKMCEKARQVDRVLAVCHYRRHFPATQAIRDVIESGKFGNCISVDWREGESYGWPAESLAQLRRENGGEVLFDIGAHVFEILTSWFKDCEVLSCEDDSLGGAAASFDIRLQSNQIPIRVSLSRKINWGNQVRLEFEKGGVVWNTLTPNKIEVLDKTLPMKECTWVFGEDNPHSIIKFFQAELESFSNAAWGKKAPTVSGESAIAYVSLLEQCEKLRISSPEQLRPSWKINWPLKNRTIAVTGASGFIGGRLTELAIESELDVVPMARRPSSCVSLLQRGIEPRLGNLSDKEYLSSSFKNCSAVFHCAITWDTTNLASSVVEGTRNVLEAALAEGVQSVVVLGSMMSYGQPPPHGLVAETYVGIGHDPYGSAKAKMVDLVQGFCKKHKDMHVVIIEPTCVFGPNSAAFVENPAKQMRANEFYLVDQGKGVANLIFVDNLVDALLKAATAGDLSGMRFIVNEEENGLTWSDYFGRLAEALGTGPLPSYDKVKMLLAARDRFKKKNGIQLFREAVRNYRPCAEYVSNHPLFRLSKKLRQNRSGTIVSSDSATQFRPKSRPYSTGAVQVPKQIPYPAYIEMYSSDATYDSTAFRTATGWKPAVSSEQSLRQTLDWAQQIFPRW